MAVKLMAFDLSRFPISHLTPSSLSIECPPPWVAAMPLRDSIESRLYGKSVTDWALMGLSSYSDADAPL
jgi:hypothetical protein